MRIDGVSPKLISITLSKRNLLTLLDKLEWNSARTIAIENEDGITLCVHAEPDDVHYANRFPPGKMMAQNGDLY